MTEDSINETQPMQTGSTDAVTSAGETMPTRITGENVPASSQTNAPASPPNKPAKKRRFAWIGITIVAWIVLIGVAVLSAYQGYNVAIADRISIQSTEAVTKLDEQYELGIKDYASGEYERARQRFQFIIDQDPNYLKALEMLARTLAVLQATATPTAIVPTATPTLTPTPDLRAIEDIFTAARAAMEAEDWDTAISTLLALRQKDPAYNAVDVDSMLYVAFRYRGVYKILNTGQLEGGLLDLSQAELFGPLDADAQSYANFAKLFGIGVSFWEVDWSQAAYYFEQVAPFLPNMHNGDNWYASQRYIEALQHYIDQLIAADNWCEAQIQMQKLRDYSQDPQFDPTQTAIDDQCSGGGDQDEDEGDGEPEATPIPEATTAPEVTTVPEATTPPEATPVPQETTPPAPETPVPSETPTP